MNIGENIRKYRKALGLTQIQLAEKLGTTQFVITNYERGTNNPLTSSLPDIAKALGVSIDQLFGFGAPAELKSGVKKSSREGKLLAAFQKLTPAQQRLILQQVEALAGE